MSIHDQFTPEQLAASRAAAAAAPRFNQRQRDVLRALFTSPAGFTPTVAPATPMSTTAPLRLPDSPMKLVEFEEALAAAQRGAILTDTGAPAAVQAALEIVAETGAPESIAAARVAFAAERTNNS